MAETGLVELRLRECVMLVKLVAMGDAKAAVDACQRITKAADALATKEAEIAGVRGENTRLRAALAQTACVPL